MAEAREERALKQINYNSLLKNATSLPVVKIDRDNFLRSALKKYYNNEIIEKAIAYNPAYAGINVEKINKIAKSSINYETAMVSTLSFAAGIPGGFAMFGTIPADFVQYFGHILRILQKLTYLYGWQDLFDENGRIDDETANLLTLFTGVMFGVSGATGAISKIANKAAINVAKKLPQKALTKGLIYPIVKKVATMLGIEMTKDIFAKGVSKIIPVVGGIASGSITLVTYRPMAEKLRKYLSTLKLADTEFYTNSSSATTFNEEKIETNGIEQN